MNKSVHFFDPAFESLYTGKFTHSGIIWKDNNAEIQSLFYQLNHPELQQNTLSKAYNFIQYQLKQVAQDTTHKTSPDFSMNNLSSLQVLKIPPVEKHLCTEDNVYRWIKQTTLVMLTQPCWLQNSSPAVASQTFVSIHLMSLYSQLTQKSYNSVTLQQSYHALLLAAGIKIPKLSNHSFNPQTEQLPSIFDFATTQLALAHFPRILLPEILGFTLAFCQAPTLIEICFPEQHTTNHFYQLHQQLLEENLALVRQCIATYLDLFPQQTRAIWNRLQNGFFLYQLQMQRSCKQFNDTLNTPSPTHHAVAKLLLQKSVAAIGHHHKIKLQGVSLEQWFAGLPANSEKFLQALVHSDYIDKQNPSNSRLLKLFDFNGPMFGVLNKSEQTILLNWLQDELRSSSQIKNPVFMHETKSHHAHEKNISTNKTSTQQQNKPTNYTKLSNRELYYYLVNLDLFPDALPSAKHKIHRLLNACACVNPLPFKHYSHQQFDTFIENIYQREINAYVPLQGTPKISKEAYIWGFEQIAPMILIDGCWIQNSQTLQNVHPEISAILFSIYNDEIGCGQLQQNHPYIFQQLLDSLSIQVPKAYSREFIEHSGFINSAFDLPVYMLALSSCSVEFLPELLGLNMAIELSGLGKSYMRLVDDWNYWGIDPSIANIHISIDNYAGGHTFLAKKAIHLYMEGIMQNSSNTAVVNKYWKRIYNGYNSLRFVGGRFKLSLPVCYLIHKLKLNK